MKEKEGIMSVNFKRDKRSVKTRYAIKLALFKLLKSNDIESVTITEITRIAGINRNSFYTHYTSISNVLDDVNNDILSEIDDILKDYTYQSFKENPAPVIGEFSKALYENKYFAEYILFSKNAVELIYKLKRYICDRALEQYRTERETISPFVPYMVGFLVGGTFDMYSLWFSSKTNFSIDELTEKIVQFLSAGITALQNLK